MTLPSPLTFLADLVPPEVAMRGLVVPMRGAAPPEAVEGRGLSPALEALAWLYLDGLERAHEICQSVDGPTGAHLHAIVHRREGDFGNALYWYRRAGEADGEGARLTRVIEAGDCSEAAVARQRAEWAALAARCAA